MPADEYDFNVITERVEDIDFKLRIDNNNGQSYDDPDIMRMILAVYTYQRNILFMQKPDDRQITLRVRIGESDGIFSREQIDVYVNARATEDVFCYARDHNPKDAPRLAESFLSVLHHYEQVVPAEIRDRWHNFSSGKNLASEVIKASEKTVKS